MAFPLRSSNSHQYLAPPPSVAHGSNPPLGVSDTPPSVTHGSVPPLGVRDTPPFYTQGFHLQPSVSCPFPTMYEDGLVSHPTVSLPFVVPLTITPNIVSNYSPSNVLCMPRLVNKCPQKTGIWEKRLPKTAPKTLKTPPWEQRNWEARSPKKALFK